MNATGRVLGVIWGGLGLTLVLATPGQAFSQEYECDSTGCEDSLLCGPPYKVGDGQTCLHCHNTYSSGRPCAYQCEWCGDQLVADAIPSAKEIVDALESASGGGLGEVVDQHGQRMLLHAARNMVVVTGGCSGQELSTIVDISEARTRRMEALGVRSLEEYLASEDT